MCDYVVISPTLYDIIIEIHHILTTITYIFAFDQ